MDAAAGAFVAAANGVELRTRNAFPQNDSHHD
jgi:hypothetical protein